MNKQLLLLLLPGMLLLLRCSVSPLAGGSTDTELGSVASGMVYDGSGKPALNTQVDLLPQYYNPVADTPLPHTFTDTTDSGGSYLFRNVPAGLYTVIAVHLKSGRKLLITGVGIGGKDTVEVPPDTLRKTGSIVIEFPETVDTGNSYVYIPGTFFFAPVASNTVIDSLPAGAISQVYYCDETDTAKNHVVATDVSVQADDTVHIVDRYLWGYSAVLHLNTAATGSEVPNDVMDFPVLVRLASEKFDFRQAQGQGEDLRFAKTDGTPLSHEIERWDSANGAAEIWVRVDTVFGDNSLQSITMYWGNPVATGAANSAAVFDTAAGFQGVWHLAATGDTAPDATGNGYDGSGYYTSPVRGIIGNAQQFNGKSSYIRIEGTAPESRLNFPMDGRYSVSAWVYHDTLIDSVTYLIAGKGELQYFLKTFGLAQSTPNHVHHWEFTEYHENDNWQGVTYTPAAAGTWNYLVGVKDGPDQFLYVNGVLVMAKYRVFGTGQVLIPRDTTDDFSIGAFLRQVDVWDQGYAFFNGAIDEVGVASTPRSADWIKLCYMNQKAQDALVQW